MQRLNHTAAAVNGDINKTENDRERKPVEGVKWVYLKRRIYEHLSNLIDDGCYATR
jgi:hypothetical protein